MANKYTYALGRRKTAVATVRLFEEVGQSLINDKPVVDALKGDMLHGKVAAPFVVCELDPKKYSFTAKASGGGVNAQAEAIRLGLARCLIQISPEYRVPLKQAGFLTRDPRMVERKKAGHRKARKSEQYSKR